MLEIPFKTHMTRRFHGYHIFHVVQVSLLQYTCSIYDKTALVAAFNFIVQLLKLEEGVVKGGRIILLLPIDLMLLFAPGFPGPSAYIYVRHTQNDRSADCYSTHPLLWTGFSLLHTEDEGRSHAQDLGMCDAPRIKHFCDLLSTHLLSIIILVPWELAFKEIVTFLSICPRCIMSSMRVCIVRVCPFDCDF